ncbi:TonB-dependent receptor plug domain-containing protein [Terricaulis sp.]|uniref:TonB-dependent receptor plug domain-containing protein n=1 Tax=Terricaulis sp. TaxID=2768686 RepID=UPI003783C44A
MLGRLTCSALALMTGVAYAQENTTTSPAATTETAATPENSADRVSYDAAYFVQYQPQTALDMVNQTPGFTLDSGDGRRGFSGAVGNVLVDGLRPSTKSQSVDGILSRIPANQVLRIELWRGALVAGDASGQAILLNVVRTPSAGSGVYNAGFEYTSEHVVAPRGELTYSGRSGNIEYGLSGSVFTQFRSLPGWRRFYDGAGDYTGRADTPSPRNFREYALTGNLAFPLWGGRVSSTAQLDWWRFHADSDFIFFDDLDTHVETLSSDFTEQQPSFEIGVNYDRDLGPWTLSLVSLANRRFYESEETATDTDGADALNFILFQGLDRDTGETIGRASLARALTPTQRIEFGGETALNFLEQGLVLTQDTGSGPAALSIPNGNVRVEEMRYEFFGSHTWRPNDQWTVETRLAYETSTLTFTGDTEQEVELAFWKPSIQVSRTFAGNNQLRLRLYRDVGQLDFDDFASAAGIADNLINGGNPDLVPQTDIRAELGADLRFPGGAALALTLTRHWYQDVADVVPIVDDNGTPGNPADDIRFDAPGNIGDADAWSLDANFSLPLGFIIPGGRVTVEGYLWNTEVTDPTTGDTRIISFRPESQIEVEFRQDIRSWNFAWGFNAFKEGEVQAYRFNEVDTSEEGPWIDFWVETTALPHDMKLRLWAANAFDGTVNRDRLFYESPNRTGPLTRRDLRQRQFEEAPWLIVELSGTF